MKHKTKNKAIAIIPVAEGMALPRKETVHYSDELGEAICAYIAEGMVLPKICKMPGMPTMRNIFYWVVKNPEFKIKYELASEVRAEVMIEEMIEIADDKSEDCLQDTWNGKTFDVENREFIQRSRVRIETRKWIASKIKPKKYGDRQTIEHDGSLTIRKTEIEMPTKLPVGAALV